LILSDNKSLCLDRLHCASDYTESTMGYTDLGYKCIPPLFLLLADRKQWELSKGNVLFYCEIYDWKIAIVVRH